MNIGAEYYKMHPLYFSYFLLSSSLGAEQQMPCSIIDMDVETLQDADANNKFIRRIDALVNTMNSQVP